MTSLLGSPCESDSPPSGKRPRVTISGTRYNLLMTAAEVPMRKIYKHDGFDWLPIVTEQNGLICKLDILMLREGVPRAVLHDVDNRLKTLFDALRKAKDAQELGAKTIQGQLTPQPDENPFY